MNLNFEKKKNEINNFFSFHFHLNLKMINLRTLKTFLLFSYQLNNSVIIDKRLEKCVVDTNLLRIKRKVIFFVKENLIFLKATDLS